MGWSKEKFLREADEIRSIIDARGPKKDIDATALSMLATQERMVRANTLRFEDMDLGSDHLIHGDLTSEIYFLMKKIK